METAFMLTHDQLIDIAKALEDRVEDGLKTDGQEVRCLLTYVPATDEIKSNRAIVLDLGGTNVRSAVLRIENEKAIIEKGPEEAILPIQRGVPLEKKKFLDVQANLIQNLNPESGLPLGYCFSYPTRSTYEGDAELLNWTKEVVIPDTVGHNVGKMLLDHMKTDVISCKHAVVINDTIASLFSGLTLNRVDANIGLIVGTGTNMAMFIDSKRAQKLSSDLNWSGEIPVNLESGNFNPPHLNHYDEIVDAQSENPGSQIFEKAVSGAYLGRILKAVFPKSAYDSDFGSRGVVEIAYNSDNSSIEARVARNILSRSAQLVAASLAGLLHLIATTKSVETARIMAEGSLFWKAPGYSDEVKKTLNSLIEKMDIPNIKVEIRSIENANLIGSAIAALVK